MVLNFCAANYIGWLPPAVSLMIDDASQMHCKGTTFWAKKQIRSPLYCKNMLTLHLDIANIIFSPRKCIVCVSCMPSGQCDKDIVTISTSPPPNCQTHKIL